MNRVHGSEALLFQPEGKRFDSVGDLQIFGRERQDGMSIRAPRFVRDAVDFVSQRFGTQQRQLLRLNRSEHGKHRFRFNPDPGVSLVIQRALQAATIEIYTHEPILPAAAHLLNS